MNSIFNLQQLRKIHIKKDVAQKKIVNSSIFKSSLQASWGDYQKEKYALNTLYISETYDSNSLFISENNGQGGYSEIGIYINLIEIDNENCTLKLRIKVGFLPFSFIKWTLYILTTLTIISFFFNVFLGYFLCFITLLNFIFFVTTTRAAKRIIKVIISTLN